jgi:hypothetical protein
MKPFIIPAVLCLLLVSCREEKEPEPQATIIGTRPKEEQASRLRSIDSMKKAGSDFERSFNNTRRKFEKQEQLFTRRSDQFETEMRREKEAGNRKFKPAEDSIERSSRVLESDMNRKKDAAQRLTRHEESQINKSSKSLENDMKAKTVELEHITNKK